MVYNKAIAPNKCFMLPYIVKYHSKYRNFQELFDFHKKVKITKYDFVRSYDFVIYHDGITFQTLNMFENSHRTALKSDNLP